MTNVDQWAETYRSGTDGEIEAALKTFYNMECWQDLHVALWAWLSLDGERGKRDWFERFDVPEVTSCCFACEVAKKCVNCPMERNCFGWCANGLFIDWRSTTDKTKRAELARKIAEMEWEERL